MKTVLNGGADVSAPFSFERTNEAQLSEVKFEPFAQFLPRIGVPPRDDDNDRTQDLQSNEKAGNQAASAPSE